MDSRNVKLESHKNYMKRHSNMKKQTIKKK